jgi:hypothetical protein
MQAMRYTPGGWIATAMVVAGMLGTGSAVAQPDADPDEAVDDGLLDDEGGHDDEASDEEAAAGDGAHDDEASDGEAAAVPPAPTPTTSPVREFTQEDPAWDPPGGPSPEDPATPEPAEAPAPPSYRGPPLEVTGSFFNRFEYRDGYQNLGVARGRFPEGDQTVFRARLGLGVGPMDIGGGHSVFLQFTPQASGSFGTQPGTVGELNLGLHEAYMGLQGGLYRLQVGLIEMDYGDAMVIGNLDWHQTARRFQGARVRLAESADGWFVDLFATQLVEGVPFFQDPFGAGDHYFVGVYSDLGPLLAKGLTFDLYALSQLWPSTNPAPDPADPTMTIDRDRASELTLGTRIKARTGPVDYRAETGVQVGSRIDPLTNQSVQARAYHGDAELGVHMLDDKLRVSAQGLYASGNDPGTDRNEGWNELFPTAHKFLGLMDVIGPRTNVGSAVAHIQVKPMPRLSMSLDGHLFFRPHRPDEAAPYAGAEADLNVLYIIGKGLKARGLYGVFVPGPAHYLSDRVAHYVELELRYDL